MARPSFPDRVSPGPRIPAGVVGVASVLELALRFSAWAVKFPRNDPTPKQIQARWGMSRATAHRWHAAWQTVRADAPLLVLPDRQPCSGDRHAKAH